MSLSLLLAIGLVGLFLMVRGQQRQQAARRAPTDPDADALREVAATGADLERPATVEFYLYLPARERAERVAQTLGALGYETALSQDAEGSDWLCLARRPMALRLADLHEARTRLTALAESEEGVYDGWGVDLDEQRA